MIQILFLKFFHRLFLTVICSTLIANKVFALTVFGVEGGNQDVFYHNAEENLCPLKPERRLVVGTRLHRGQGLCLGEGIGKFFFRCDRPQKIPNMNFHSPLDRKGNYLVADLCPNDPGPILDKMAPDIQEGGLDKGVPYIVSPRYTLLRRHNNRPIFRWYGIEGIHSYQVSLCRWNLEGQGKLVWSQQVKQTVTKNLDIFLDFKGKVRTFPLEELPYSLDDKLFISEDVEQGITYSLIVMALPKPERVQDIDISKSDCVELVESLRKATDDDAFLSEAERIESSEAERINRSEYGPRYRKGVWELNFGFFSSTMEMELEPFYESLYGEIFQYRYFNLYAEGIFFLENFVQKHPSSFQAYLLLGDLYAENGLSELAKASYVTAIYKFRNQRAVTKVFRLKSKSSDPSDPSSWRICISSEEKQECSEQAEQFAPSCYSLKKEWMERERITRGEWCITKTMMDTAQTRLKKLYQKVGRKADWDEKELDNFLYNKGSSLLQQRHP